MAQAFGGRLLLGLLSMAAATRTARATEPVGRVQDGTYVVAARAAPPARTGWNVGCAPMTACISLALAIAASPGWPSGPLAAA